MTLKEAKQILTEQRPDRPRSTENRLLQAAIDVAIEAIDDKIEYTEKIEKMLNAMAEEDWAKND